MDQILPEGQTIPPFGRIIVKSWPEGPDYSALLAEIITRRTGTCTQGNLPGSIGDFLAIFGALFCPIFLARVPRSGFLKKEKVSFERRSLDQTLIKVSKLFQNFLKKLLKISNFVPPKFDPTPPDPSCQKQDFCKKFAKF